MSEMYHCFLECLADVAIRCFRNGGQ